jgi:hypothetical protein
MAETSELWYYIDGTDEISYVSVSLDEYIDDLKKKIHAVSPNSFKGCHAIDLVLIKVRYIMISMNIECNQWHLLAYYTPRSMRT